MDTIDLIVQAINEYYDEVQHDPNGRYRSWQHCYMSFYNARHVDHPNIDYLSLHLAFYLASWGMYRGSAFLLQKDYKIHIPVVERLLDPQCDCLFGLNCSDLRDDNVQTQLREIVTYLKSYYGGVREDVTNNATQSDISSTLITKVLLGTLGCVPAYDRYFVKGVRACGIATGTFNIRSILDLVELYEQNNARLEEVRNRLEVYNLPYPQMKLLDMAFWKIGYIIEHNNG